MPAAKSKSARRKASARKRSAPTRSRDAVDSASLSRPLQPMPADIRRKLSSARLMAAYRSRPPYQQNDYLAWIARSKTPVTREKRLDQMLRELAQGDVYMNMDWSPRRSRA
jgi:Bacteriocin-protection, YdeI or OmpD-Associated